MIRLLGVIIAIAPIVIGVAYVWSHAAAILPTLP